MGTRAVIRIGGEPMIATHWDGDPDCLGKELTNLKDKSIMNLVEVAKEHTIDCVHKSIREELNNERIKEIATKHKLTAKKVKEGYRRGNVICADDWEIEDIKIYSDFPNYEYDIRGTEVFYRTHSGEFGSASAKVGGWRKIKLS